MSTPHLPIRGIIHQLLLFPMLLGLIFGCFVSPLSAQPDPRALDPSDVFFQAWLEIQRAEKLEKAGKFSESWQKYRQAAKYYDVLSRFHKNWKPHLVLSRVESTQKTISLIAPKASAELAGKNAKTQDLVEASPRQSPPPKIKPNNSGSGQIRRPLPLSPTSTPARSTAKAQRRLLELERENRSLNDSLKRAQSSLKNSLKAPRKGNAMEQKRLIDLIAEKDREINTMRDVLARAPLRADMNRLTREKQTREQELAITARAFKESQRKLREAEQSADKHKAGAELAQLRLQQIQKDLTEERGVNNKVITSLRKELKTVTAILEKTRQDLGISNARMVKMQRQLDESQTTITELTKERNTLRIHRDSLANLLKKSDSKGVLDLITENMRLGRELKSSLDRLKMIQTSQGATQDDLLQAKSDLAIAKTRIMHYQHGQANHGKMIQSLESQLRDAHAALETARANPGKNDNQEEVEILKGTVKRLIAAQERRKMGEKILWETYQKSKSTIQGMASAIKDIRNTKVELTDEEKRLVAVRRPDGEFRNPERVPMAHALAHGDALEAEIQTYTPLMMRAFENGRFEVARQFLQEMDDRFPGRFRTLCQRGVLELKTENYEDAIEVFSEAITMQENSSYAYYMLGLAHYNNQDIDGARNSFERALNIKPGSARAHLYLGNLAGAEKRYKQAETHYLRAIELAPTDATAYYNLSVLYLQQKRKKEALVYYNKARQNGKNPDPVLQQRLDS